jgi:hypothetical protein
MNKTQKAFLKNLLKSIEQAKSSRESIVVALSIGVADREGCERYARELQQFINAAEKMKMATTLAFGKSASTIAAETLIKDNGN